MTIGQLMVIGTEAVTADENSLGAFGRMRADPFIELARLNSLLVRWQACGSVVNHFKPLTLKVAGALLVHFGREPRRTEQREPFGAERIQCGDRGRASNDHRDASCAGLQTLLQLLVIGGTAHVAAAGEGIGDCMQWS